MAKVCRVRRNRLRCHRQRGVALITVLLVFVIATVLATEVHQRQFLDFKRTGNVLLQQQSQQFALAAEALALQVLKEDRKEDDENSKQKNQVVRDHYGEAWAEHGRVFPVPGGTVQGDLHDLESRLNLNAVYDSQNGDFAKGTRDALQRLMVDLGVPDDARSVTPQDLVNNLVDWIDPDQDPIGFVSAEDDHYLLLDPAYRAANRPLRSVQELRLIKDFTLDDVEKLAPYVVAFVPKDNIKINVNTASPEVLAAYGIPQPAQLISERPDDGYVTVDDAMKAGEVLQTPVSGGANQDDENDIDFSASQDEDDDQNNGAAGGNNAGNNRGTISRYFGVSSQYYELRAKAVIENRPFYMTSIFYRPIDMEKLIRVIERRFGKPTVELQQHQAI